MDRVLLELQLEQEQFYQAVLRHIVAINGIISTYPNAGPIVNIMVSRCFILVNVFKRFPFILHESFYALRSELWLSG